MSLPTSHPDPRSESIRIPELDGIRGVAILLVVLFHYFQVTAVVDPAGFASHLLAPTRLGWTGVDLFFVLSGFLIGGILLDTRGSAGYFRTFYIRRAFRILPLYGLVVGASYLLTVILESQPSSQLSWLLAGQSPWLPYLFFLQNFWMVKVNAFGTLCLGSTWSLAVEEQFYLTLPLLIWLVEPRKLLKVLVTLVIAAPLLRTIFYFALPGNFMITFALVPFRADALLLGVLGALVMRTPAYRVWIDANSRILLAAIVVLLAGCGVFTHSASQPNSPAMRTVGYTWMALLYALILVYAITQKNSVISWVLRLSWLRQLGRIAYGIYLLHSIVLFLLTAAVSPTHAVHNLWPALDSWLQLEVTIAALVVTVVICHLSWHYFEKPLVQMGHRQRYTDALSIPADAELGVGMESNLASPAR